MLTWLSGLFDDLVRQDVDDGLLHLLLLRYTFMFGAAELC